VLELKRKKLFPCLW